MHKTLYNGNLRCNTQTVPSFSVNINSLARFKTKKEAENFRQIPSNKN